MKTKERIESLLELMTTPRVPTLTYSPDEMIKIINETRNQTLDEVMGVINRLKVDSHYNSPNNKIDTKVIKFVEEFLEHTKDEIRAAITKLYDK